MVTKFERWGLLFKPQVFNTFTVSNQNETEEFIIQDLPQDRIEEASNFMLEYYVKDETFQMATKVPKKALMDFYRFVFEQKVSLACFKKNSGELVGLNALTVKSKDVDTNFESEDAAFTAMRQTFSYINNFFDVFDHYNIIYYLYAHGLAVKPDYRGLGIATELLKARVPLMKALDLTVTASLFTTIQSQKAAEKIGFQEEFSISYEILQQKYPKFDFSIANSADCKMLSLKIHS